MVARIYKPSPSVTQSGKGATKMWVLSFDPETSMCVEPLMGWTSSGDMKRQITLRFETKEEAMAYCQRSGLAYRIEEPKPKGRRVFSYADNFKTGRLGQWTH